MDFWDGFNFRQLVLGQKLPGDVEWIQKQTQIRGA